MFPNQPTQTLVHLPRQQPSRSPEGKLPRGECRFIHKQPDQDGARQRCTCVSFTLNQQVPGSQCGCGHNAWHHITEPTGDYVSHEAFQAMSDKVRILEEQARIQQDEMARERKEKERMARDLQQFQNSWYQNLYYMRFYVDEKMEKLRLHTEDKIEGIEDKTAEIDRLAKNHSDLDDAVMRLEERLESGRRTSRSMTPLLEGQTSPIHPPHPERAAPELPIRLGRERHHPDSWDVRVILLPTKHMQFAYPIDSVAWRRCQTRGLHQDIHLQDHTADTFLRRTETSFMAIFRRRPWMPLQCLKSSDMSLCQLPQDAIVPEKWSYEFLEQQCLAHEKLLGDVVFIALQHDDLAWEDIRALPRVFGSDESCWEHDDQLDGSNKEAIAAEDRMETERSVVRDSTYEYNSPPPYSSRASMYTAGETPRQVPFQGPLRGPSFALDMLATASLASRHRGVAPSISERSNHSAPSIISQHSASTMGSIDSTIALSEADEHRSKRTKRYFIKSPSQPSLLGGIASEPTSPQEPMVVSSGRTKRRITAAKIKEPMNWGTSDISFKGMLHRHGSKEKRPQTSGGQSQAESHSTTSTS